MLQGLAERVSAERSRLAVLNLSMGVRSDCHGVANFATKVGHFELDIPIVRTLEFAPRVGARRQFGHAAVESGVDRAA